MSEDRPDELRAELELLQARRARTRDAKTRRRLDQRINIILRRIGSARG